MKWSGILNSVTYNQTTEPTGVTAGETWLNVDILYMRNRTNTGWVAMTTMEFSPLGHGYLCGGYSSSIDRITFASDSGTAILAGSLTQSTYGSIGFNSTQHGFICGNLSNIERMIFPMSSGTSSIVGNLSQSVSDGSGFNSSKYGYVCGGGLEDIPYSFIERLTFPFNSGTATSVGSMTQSIAQTVGFNSSDHGYINGGYSYGLAYLRSIERISFPFDYLSVGSLVGEISLSKCQIAGFNSSLNGYLCGGNIDPGFNDLSIERLTFPFNSGTTLVVGTLNNSVQLSMGVNSSNYGYNMGGHIDDGTNISNVERIVFPFDSGTAFMVGNLTRSVYRGLGIDDTDFISMFI